MRPEYAARFKRLGVAAVVVISVGLGYAVLSDFGISIPCVFHTVTGLYCPGCGISRMCLSLLRGDVAAAFRYNAAALTTMPFFAFWGISAAYRYIKTGSGKMMGGSKTLIGILLGLFLLFGVLRNLPALWFLAPA